MTTRRTLRGAARAPIRELHGQSREFQQLQQTVKGSTHSARQDQFSRGVALTVTLDGSTTQVVPHKLGRKPQAVAVTAQPSAAVWTTGQMTTRTIKFTSSAAGTTVFWVY